MLGAFKLNSISKSGIKPYWSLTYQGTGAETGTGSTRTHSALDSSDNVYTVLTTTSPTLIGTRDIIVFKTNKLGSVLWTRRLGIASAAFDSRGIEVVGSTVYVMIEPTSGSYADRGMVFLLDASTGSLSSNTTYNLNAGSSSVGVYLEDTQAFQYHSATDNFIYYSRANGATTSSQKFIRRYNSSLTASVQLITNAASATFEILEIDVQPGSATPSVVGLGYEVVGSPIFELYSWNTSSGTLNFAKEVSYSGTGASTDPYAAGTGSVKVDSSGNIYIWTRGNSPLIGYLTKINSSGVVQWTRGFADIVLNCRMVIDGTSNIYLIATESITGYQYLFKFDSSGSLIYQNRFTAPTNVTWSPHNIKLSNDKSYLLISGSIDFSSVGGSVDSIIMKIPSNGTGLGSWNVSATGTSNITYASSSVSMITTHTTVLTNLSSFTVTSSTGSTGGNGTNIWTTNTSGLNAVTVKLP